MGTGGGWGGEGRNVSKMGEFDKKEVEINRWGCDSHGNYDFP